MLTVNELENYIRAYLTSYVKAQNDIQQDAFSMALNRKFD